MQLAHLKHGIRSLIEEWERDIPTLGAVSAKYHRYMVQTLSMRLARIERELADIRFVEIKD